MRTLNVGTQETVEGLITDLRKNDLTLVQDIVELAFTDDEVTDGRTIPEVDWSIRDTVETIGRYSLIAGKSHDSTEVGFFKLWARWSLNNENVLLLVGRFRVV